MPGNFLLLSLSMIYEIVAQERHHTTYKSRTTLTPLLSRFRYRTFAYPERLAYLTTSILIAVVAVTTQHHGMNTSVILFMALTTRNAATDLSSDPRHATRERALLY